MLTTMEDYDEKRYYKKDVEVNKKGKLIK